MSVVICGSVAYDNIMEFDGRFGDLILPDQIHILSVAFEVPKLRKEFGGCAGNIAYNLKLLGGDPHIIAAVGKDFGLYEAWLNKHQISTKFIKKIANKFTAQCFITTDSDNNQLTSFHPGAMDEGHLNPIPDETDLQMGILAPDGKLGTQKHAEQLVSKSVPFIFDPGQGIPLFNKKELNHLIELANWIVVNEYEANLLSETTESSIGEIAKRVQAMVITKGASGSEIIVNAEMIPIDPVKAETEADPTGCGDAFRAALIYGICNEMSWEEMGRLGSLMGSIKVAKHGTQNHSFTLEELLHQL
jgi:adenosine kinase